MPEVNIQSFSQVIPMIYAYSTPEIAKHRGWVKIGYTERQTVDRRIDQQTHTAGVDWKLEWQDNAMYKDGSGTYFTDRAFHDFLEVEKRIEREPGTEWFHIDGVRSQMLFTEFARRQTHQPDEGCSYTLRAEQVAAVEQTMQYFRDGGKEFLWNAKPRFGKTLTSYDLVRRMGLMKVLIVTNRPSIANSWAEDFRKFIGWRGEQCFVSETEALKGKPGVMTRKEYEDAMFPLDDWKGMVAFESLQGLKGSVYFGGEYKKLKWIKDLEFDLLIVDEAQEGVDTMRTERAFDNVRRKYTLYLSGTPFKQLASDQFRANQIFNWAYSDEQHAKDTWESEDRNPYAELPRMSMFTYQLSNMIYEQVQRGLDLSGEDGTVDYAFDLNEFFLTNDAGRLIHEDEIRRFLRALATQEKYPFSTPELRQQLSHTLWILNRVASCKALMRLLQEDETFSEYEVVLAAGDGKLNEEDEAKNSFDRVKKAIATHEKTITLSVGQLTVGVTIKEWSGVLMLCNMKSPSSYMQAAFRAQNPCIFKGKDGSCYRKEVAYVFDFDPARTLIIYDEFANNLTPETAAGRGTSDDRKENIRRLLNFFPVLGEDTEGTMIELDPDQVLTIPRKLKSQEVVKRGFMSNFLFTNIGNVFGAPAVVREIVEKLQPAHEEKPNPKKKDPIQDIDQVEVDENGETVVDTEHVIGTAQGLFGEKVYEDMEDEVHPKPEELDAHDTPEEVHDKLCDLMDSVKDTVRRHVMPVVEDSYDMKPATKKRLEKQVDREIERSFTKLSEDYRQQTNIAQAELDHAREVATTKKEVEQAEQQYQQTMEEAMDALKKAVDEAVDDTIQSKPQQLVAMLEKEKADRERHSIEDSVRAHLRGFSRTIPSFIMAYGNERLTLGNFDEYTEAAVFEEVTGITLDNFRFLRDGGDYVDEESGEIMHFPGHLFDEVVFDDSIQEFWRKRQELANYFDDSAEEDIFDYIPPQKTNQIFTPKWVVQKMVDELEANNPGCFDDPEHTFADLYMKSGLYITEIVKRLYRSEAMKRRIPNDNERIHHILRKQVYGMAPTRIIFLIATNYILGFDKTLQLTSHNFVECDAAEASKAGTLQQMVDRYFGD